MSDLLYREDAYRREAEGEVIALTGEGGIVVSQAVFYPTGGGQPGDSGWLEWSGGRLPIATTVKGEGGASVLLPSEPAALPAVGTKVLQVLDWERRHKHMRVHTALHLLSVVIPLPVTGGQIGPGSGRLDFHMPQPPEDRDALQQALNDLIDRDLEVSEDWISEEELDARPDLVKTLSVQPPREAGRIRLIRIGRGGEQVDLQPCGGTHVARTGEIGCVTLGKIENKGKQNRRVHIALS
ncbi:alanyl-tRNA editing protein [Antarctobacter jejuensis]|uniref:alanyl-tRNA editing protein n=1 Tax=Antarctobacter jejuensis TaxID=1439938 RepID=UPI003FCFC1A3